MENNNQDALELGIMQDLLPFGNNALQQHHEGFQESKFTLSITSGHSATASTHDIINSTVSLSATKMTYAASPKQSFQKNAHNPTSGSIPHTIGKANVMFNDDNSLRSAFASQFDGAGGVSF